MIEAYGIMIRGKIIGISTRGGIVVAKLSTMPDKQKEEDFRDYQFT